MKDLFNDVKREFMARYLADLSKAVFAVTLASKFFFELSVPLRILLPVAGIVFFIIAFFIHPGGKK